MKIEIFKLMIRQLLGIIGHIFAPGYGDCYRCRMPWKFTKHHSTQYSPSSGCFPLCERCWSELQSPEARLPYYRKLWNNWQRYPHNNEKKWEWIEKAVREGK